MKLNKWIYLKVTKADNGLNKNTLLTKHILNSYYHLTIKAPTMLVSLLSLDAPKRLGNIMDWN